MIEKELKIYLFSVYDFEFIPQIEIRIRHRCFPDRNAGNKEVSNEWADAFGKLNSPVCQGIGARGKGIREEGIRELGRVDE
jgi:hypothetical protein